MVKGALETQKARPGEPERAQSQFVFNPELYR